MLKTERQPSAVLTSVAVRVTATVRDLFVSETPYLSHTHRQQTAQTWALRIGNIVVLPFGSSLAAIIATLLLVAAAIWGLVIVMTWRELLRLAFGS